VIFVSGYGLRALYAALKPTYLVPAAGAARTKRTVWLSALAFSFLNPHAILDTMILIGSIGSQQPQDYLSGIYARRG
jgi:L-lysine exporter family protein LysE/ArgO